jgi:membrane protein DedA with SNARE-associated domain
VAAHSEIVRSLAFVERYGYALLFAWVLAEQGAIPLPSAPLLLAVGALIRDGRLGLWPAVLSCLGGALAADTLWFELGRRRGRKVLELVCRLSLEPDSCVRQTETTFGKYGLRSLLISKFIPGLNAVAAPLAGHSNVAYLQFAAYDATGALVWCGSYLGAGYLFRDQLETLAGYASGMGANFGALVAALFAGWIAWKYSQRRRFLRHLRVARITPAELRDRIATGEQLLIVDLRAGSADTPALIPGALRISPEELAARSREIPREREVILFCA